MWIWAQLQLEPTRDTLAIKRAYAKRLKTTRPDDDAAAYQRLREAYDHALAWAKHAPPDDDDWDDDHDGWEAPDAHAEAIASRSDALRVATTDDAETPHPPVDAMAADTRSAWIDDSDAGTAPADDGFATDHGPLAASGTDAPSPDATRVVAPIDPQHTAEPGADSDGVDHGDAAAPGPEDVARGVHAAWLKHGDDALLSVWPQVRRDLDRMPFAQRDASSDWMASLVLDSPTLPPAFIETLAEYFQWGVDFRVTRALGAERAFALFERLRDLGILRSNDPALQRRYADVLRLHALLAAGRRVRAWVFALLLPERVFERWMALHATQRNRLRIDPDAADAINRRLHAAFGLRGMMLLPIFAAIGYLWSASNGLDAFERAALVAIFGMLAVVTVFLGAMWLHRGLDRLLPPRIPRMPWLASPPGHLRLGGGVLLALASAIPLQFAGAGASAAAWLAWASLTIAAVAITWSSSLRARSMLLPVTAALSVALRPLLPESLATPGVISLALAWTLCANWLLARQPERVIAFYRSPLTYFRPTQAWGWILWVVFIKGVLAVAAALTVLSLPLTLMVQSLGYGQRFAIITMAAGLLGGVALAGNASATPLPLLCLLGTAIVMSLLQAAANLLARSRVFG